MKRIQKQIEFSNRKIQDITNRLSDYFVEKPVKKVYLFGSVARGEDDSTSDIDLLLELEYIKGISKVFIQMNQEIPLILNKKVDIITTESLNKYMKKFIDKEKVLIYEKV